MLSEFLIYAPSIGRYRKADLEEAVTRAHLATLALDPNFAVKLIAELGKKVLAKVGAHGIMLVRPDRRVLGASGAAAARGAGPPARRRSRRARGRRVRAATVDGHGGDGADQHAALELQAVRGAGEVRGGGAAGPFSYR